ncbi:MAG TPA: sodium:proton exchanger [Nitrospira sp.]|nr:sodium:proton exchanger [Nitrospira sp.]
MCPSARTPSGEIIVIIPGFVFAVTAAAIVLVGTRLSRHGDRIAELTGLGRLWVGVVLMAAATSLPEVLTTMSASWMDAPDLAAGDLFGAGMSNMLTLGLIDLLYRHKRVWQQAAFGHTLTAALAMVLTGLAAFCVLLRIDVVRFGVGIESLVLLILYILGMRLVFRQEDMTRRQLEHQVVVKSIADPEQPSMEGSRRNELRRALWGFSIGTLALLIAAPILAWSAGRIAEESGITATFIGTSLVAITTSLPELVVSISAIRLGAFDLAVGNLFGSNAFNMAAFFFADLTYQQGGLLSTVSSTHALTALWSIVMMNIGLMGIIYRAERRFRLIEPDSLLMIIVYILGLWLLFNG